MPFGFFSVAYLGEIAACVPLLDRDGRIVDAQNARAFAGCGANAAGEFGEVVRLVQTIERFLPEPAIDEIVPLGNEVVDRAAARHAADEPAGVAIRNAAVHATRRLLAQLAVVSVRVKLVPIRDAFHRVAIERQLTGEFEESCRFGHLFIL